MDNIQIFNRSMPSIGYIARTTTRGGEFDMVSKYICFLTRKYKNLKKKNVAIFIEPQIDTGYPDVVIVEYYSNPNDVWNHARNKLTTTDLKILFYIQSKKNTSLIELSQLLGFAFSDIEKSVLRLAECNLIHVSKNKIRNVQLHTFCRIKKIISIEAKLDKWSDAIQQAERNIWFSTESYILMNKQSCNQTILGKCKERGIGIILINGKIEKALESNKRTFPVSYASLQFNEWIQRALCCEEANQ